MITGLAHICFIVKDIEASVHFYQDQLGLRHGFDFLDEKGARCGLYLHCGERTSIELFQREPVAAEEKTSYQHCCLEVDDIDATVAQLRANGVEVTDPVLGDDHAWQAWLRDPDGNRIELHAYTPESKQVAAMGRE